ncbi:hypothetical protein BU25DRAFT_213236 [Macroventuria anomochaeta]|uniref:Uncharacterized protein n=1 Tax=Macroventuria anomochaeta TaxID=301207 RepID=A0ACB6RKK1_9PLEO|nr:uncharacterized protein BU25DRAFT_213236 [Macroventuria anomochaeta]KAF2622232.1 hypothetical protein BU25DRAFT_213236 [Macroventuria anomochaeta]
MQMLAHSPGLAKQLAHSPSTPTIRIVESSENSNASSHVAGRDARTATPISIDSSTPGQSSLRRRTQKSASLSLRTKEKESSSRKSTPTRRPRGNTVPCNGTPQGPQTPEHKKDGAESVLSFTPSVRGQQLANWFSGLLGR